MAPSTDHWVTSQGTDAELSRAQNEPSVAISPVNNNVLVAGANDWRAGVLDCQTHPIPWLGIYLSTDGGLTWTNGLLDRDNPALAGFDASYDPVIAFDGTGTLYYAGGVRNAPKFPMVGVSTPCDQQPIASNLSIFVARKNDPINSRFDSVTVVALGTGTNPVTDKPWIAVDTTQNTQYRGRVYLCWSVGFDLLSPRIIRFSYSTDRAVTWSSPVDLISGSTDLNQGCSIGIDPSSNVYVGFRHRGSDGDTVKIVKSTNGGQSFGTPILVSTITAPTSGILATRFRATVLPVIAADDVTPGYVYATWQDNRNAATDSLDVLFSRSTNGGTTWSTPRKVNDDTLLPDDADGIRNDQLYPSISVSSGVVSVAFYDRRLDRNNILVDLFLGYSSDGGATFAQNMRVSDLSTDPGVQASPFAEDYITVTSISQGSISLIRLVWTDTRDPPPSGVPSNEDIYTDSLTISNGGGSVAAGTLITLANGSTVPVQDLETGARLLLLDVYTQASRPATLTSIRQVSTNNMLTILTAKGMPLRVDANPQLMFYVLTDQGPTLTPVVELHPGDLLYSNSLGEWVEITKILVLYGGTHEFYDLLTDPYLTSQGNYLSFIANGYADPCQIPCKQGPVP